MQSFKDLKIDLVYETSTSNINNELIIPILSHTKLYRRGVGYFSASWIQLVSKGLLKIVENNGKVQLITSPKMNDEEWAAIKTGTIAQKDEMLKSIIKRTINSEFQLADRKEALNLFSWLIADEILELKIAICKENNGDYHDKLSIFEDFDNNIVVLHGSLNDSLQATFNGEGVTTFKSWIPGQNDYIYEHKKRFNELWNAENDFYEIFPASEAITKIFKDYAFSNERPYKIKQQRKKIIEKRDYQEEAINNLKNNNWRGILNMATGTGKTITSLLALNDIYKEIKKCFVVIYVPFTHLVEQWSKEFENMFGFAPLLCFDCKNTWQDKLYRLIRNYNNNINNTNFVAIITTYATGSMSEFTLMISMVSNNLCMISDECHNVGAGKTRNALIEQFKYRIGLSATPSRWLDPEGTAIIKGFFDKVVYEYSLKKAIDNNKLVKYKYYPQIISLNYDEYYRYNELTNKISKMFAFITDDSSKEEKDKLNKVRRERAKIIVLAEEKKQYTINLLKERYNTQGKNHILIYCGEHQIDEMTLSIRQIGYKPHKFDSTVSIKDREKILREFDAGNIEVLVAIRCLDEGVDIPSTKIAYFMGSNSNPKQFIQRRGRILRKCEGKQYAEIYDMIVMPNKSISSRFDNGDNLDLSIINKELPRLLEFASCASNEVEAMNIIKRELEKYDLEYLLHVDPAELYNRVKEGVEEDE